MTISTSEENDISAYTEKAVTFTVSITGGKKADYLVKLLESE
jgi:hypothetical protein